MAGYKSLAIDRTISTNTTTITAPNTHATTFPANLRTGTR